MTKNLLIAFVVIIFCQTSYTQKASDVLENGIPVNKGHRIFIKYDIESKTLKIDDVEKEQNVDFTTMQDSIIYLVRKNAVNIYLRPLNPLNYTHNTETKVVIDPINQAAETALGDIIGVLDTTKALRAECVDFTDLKGEIEKIQKKLLKFTHVDIAKIFEALKAMTFADEKTTIDKLKTAKEAINKMDDHFKKIEKTITKAQSEVSSLSCSDSDPYILKYIFHSILKDFSAMLEEQKKRLSNLKTAYKLVKDMQEKASVGGETEYLKWCIPLGEVASKEGKISIYSVTIKESGYRLSDSKEIVSVESKELTKKSLRVRRFQRFVPEVSIGTAYTFFKYNTYGTTSDSSGVQFVASPTENLVRNINITTMINFNYYIPNSPIHPLYQLGVGINSGVPTLMTGMGLRIRAGERRLAITGGLAMTWVKELDKLNVGDQISGTDDIDKDLKFQFAKPTGYIGIQYNF
jgi:hypothetical protein